MIIDDYLFKLNEIDAKYTELLSVIDFDIMHEVAKIYEQSFLVDPEDYDDSYKRMMMLSSNRGKKFARSRLRKALRLTSDLSVHVAETKCLKTKSVKIDALDDVFEVIDDRHWRRFMLAGFNNPYGSIVTKAFSKYRDPNSVKYRTYMLAYNIYRHFLNIKLTIDDLNNLILYKHPANNVLTIIEGIDIESFTRFLVENISREVETNDIVRKAVKMLLANKYPFDDIAFYDSACTNHVIQFKDCYLEKGEFFAGQYSFIPSYWIDRCVWTVVQNGQPSRVVSAVDDLLFNICDNQSFDMEVLLSRLSTFMLNSDALKRRINYAPRAVVIYDRDKSNADALMRLLRAAVGEINCVSQMIKDFGNSRLNYFKEHSARALIIADTVGMKSKPSQKSKELMCYFMQGTEVRTGSSVKSYRRYVANTSVISYTNSIRALVDSSLDDCVETRFEVFARSSRSSSSTLKDREWFKTLETDEAAQYLLELLVLMHLDNVSRHKLLRRNYKKLSELDKF